MEPRMKLGDYLVAYLKKIGVSHLFGIPVAAKSSAFAIIEVFIGPRDLSPVTVKYIRASAKNAQVKSQA
jgi:hypothetical protein